MPALSDFALKAFAAFSKPEKEGPVLTSKGPPKGPAKGGIKGGAKGRANGIIGDAKEGKDGVPEGGKKIKEGKKIKRKKLPRIAVVR